MIYYCVELWSWCSCKDEWASEPLYTTQSLERAKEQAKRFVKSELHPALPDEVPNKIVIWQYAMDDLDLEHLERIETYTWEGGLCPIVG